MGLITFALCILEFNFTFFFVFSSMFPYVCMIVSESVSKFGKDYSECHGRKDRYHIVKSKCKMEHTYAENLKQCCLSKTGALVLSLSELAIYRPYRSMSF
uniref:Uncharacterized protein n=1 Tax=Anguilla anguilla TaxID=7936 RepID=A0A0E9WZF9_ANGAN